MLEHNGDVYACDHFVEPRILLGDIHHTHLKDLVDSAQQRRFGAEKLDTLTAQCQSCSMRRWLGGPHGDPVLT